MGARYSQELIYARVSGHRSYLISDQFIVLFQVYFHFQTWKLGRDRVLLDDSKKIGKKEPMVLVIGHKFKLEVWESIVKMMAVGEVASFKVKQEVI